MSIEELQAISDEAWKRREAAEAIFNPISQAWIHAYANLNKAKARAELLAEILAENGGVK